MPLQVQDSKLVQEGIRQLEIAALPAGREWKAWWQERLRFVEMTFGWERALIDAITRLVRNNLTLARQIRLEGEAKKVIHYDSDGFVHGEATRSPAEITREALAWFIQTVKPAQRDAPAWAEILFRGVEGCYLQQARLGLELAAIRKRGYLTLNHSASAPNPESFSETGTEVI